MKNKIIFTKIVNTNSEIVAWNGQKKQKTAQKLRDKWKGLVIYDEICTDNWETLKLIFQGYTHKIGKK